MQSVKRLNRAQRRAVVAALVEGNSIRATERMTGVSIPTVLKLLADLGAVCREYMDGALRNLKCRRVQCDEIWSFVAIKDRNIPEPLRGTPGIGSVWTWVAIDADTKLIPSFHVGTRDAACAREFISDLASRLATRVQLTTDGHKAYLEAVEGAFGADVDYAMLVKLYGEAPDGAHRYSPPKCIGTRVEHVTGAPAAKHVSTSYVERQNLTMRMSMRRFTRLTNAFSRKVENLEHAVAIHFFHYNFVRVHQTLRCPPAMEAGVTDRIWEIDDMIALLETAEAKETAGKAAREIRPGPKSKARPATPASQT